MVEGIERIPAQLEGHALGDLEVLSESKVYVVAGLRAVHIATLRAGEWVATAKIVDRKCVVHNEVNVTRVDQRARSRPCLGRALAGADVDQLRGAQVAAGRFKRRAAIAQQRPARIRRGPNEGVVEGRVAIRVAVV